jgi:hypothetical protein
MKSELKTRTLQNLADAYSSHELRIKEEYQRGTVWKLPQKQGLIDSLLRDYQIPLFYVHLESRMNEYTREVEKTAWIVDGQQRLAAIVDYRKNVFSLPDPQNANPADAGNLPSWSGKQFDELSSEDKDRLLKRELLVIEMTAEPNEVRSLFIRLQAGTPLTAQQKRDAWPGNFTNFVIRHAGKPGHPLAQPKRFFDLFPSHPRRVTVDDGDHYVDGLAEVRKFFAGLAMTLMQRERLELDFVDLKGKTINEFYVDNLELNEKDDPGALRVIHVLDLVAQLPGFESLLEGPRIKFQWAFHLALLVDSLEEGLYAPTWRQRVIPAFTEFKQDVAQAKLHYSQTHELRPHHERFGRLLGGSGSDTAEVIRMRHSFLLSELYSKIQITPLDPNRLFGGLEREVIWNRDRGQCQNPNCVRPGRRVPFREAAIHHVIEHTVGGRTLLQNGVLICPECHADRGEMQRLTSHFQEYLQRIYANPNLQTANEVGISDGLPNGDNDAEESGVRSTGGRLKIVIDWGALDVDRETQTIAEARDSDSVIKLLVELIGEFGEHMKKQLIEFPVIRYPLSKTPATDFLNRARGTAYSSIQVPGTDLHFCPQSQRTEKVERLKKLFARLTLPDGSDFPPDSIEVSIDAV